MKYDGSMLVRGQYVHDKSSEHSVWKLITRLPKSTKGSNSIESPLTFQIAKVFLTILINLSTNLNVKLILILTRFAVDRVKPWSEDGFVLVIQNEPISVLGLEIEIGSGGF